jgi:cytoskeletal protein CcmA (bactofilin family)
VAPVEVAARPRHPAPDQATIGKGVVVKGYVTGVDPVFVDGRVEGSIQITGERVTVGKSGTVVGRPGSSMACIAAREIVILGTVTGNIAAGERVDIRAGASLTGDVTTVRVSIEDGAFFRGGIDIRREDPKTVSAAPLFDAVQPA